MTRRIHVAAAVILAADQRILIARRPEHKHQGGLWEFPGGKVEPDETVAAALHRELREELAISVQSAEPLSRGATRLRRQGGSAGCVVGAGIFWRSHKATRASRYNG